MKRRWKLNYVNRGKWQIKKLVIMFMVCLLTMVVLSTGILAKCPSKLEIYDSSSSNPLQGPDSGTVCITGETCNGGLHNKMQARVKITESLKVGGQNVTNTKNSALYQNKKGQIYARLNAVNKMAVKAEGYRINRCYICNTGNETFTYFASRAFSNN